MARKKKAEVEEQVAELVEEQPAAEPQEPEVVADPEPKQEQSEAAGPVPVGVEVACQGADGQLHSGMLVGYEQVALVRIRDGSDSVIRVNVNTLMIAN